jgi:hypothetical protein
VGVDMNWDILCKNFLTGDIVPALCPPGTDHVTNAWDYPEVQAFDNGPPGLVQSHQIMRQRLIDAGWDLYSSPNLCMATTYYDLDRSISDLQAAEYLARTACKEANGGIPCETRENYCCVDGVYSERGCAQRQPCYLNNYESGSYYNSQSSSSISGGGLVYKTIFDLGSK